MSKIEQSTLSFAPLLARAGTLRLIETRFDGDVSFYSRRKSRGAGGERAFIANSAPAPFSWRVLQ